MFLKLIKEDFSWPRSKRALLVFLLLWLGGLLLGLSHLFGVRSHLQEIERDQTEKLLDNYLASNRSSSPFLGFSFFQQGNALQGLVFVRIIQGHEQMVVVGEQAGSLSYKGLINLPLDRAGVWLPVGREDNKHLLTIIVRDYQNGLLIQAGKDSRESHRLYSQLLRHTILIVFCSILLLWPLSLYLIKLSLAPLTSTRQKIADLLQGSQTALLPEKGSGPELDSLYGQINQLIRQNRHLVFEMQQSLDNVAHDLRTPMTRLRSVAEYGLQAEDDTSRLRDALSDCLEESDRVLAMLRIMMSVAEAESGTMRLELQQCDVLETLRQVVTLFEYVAEDKGIDVQLQEDTTDKDFLSSAPALLDVTRISQVWANLLDNGIKYTQKGGWVKIAAGIDDGELVVSFTDNGMGISESEQGRIWERLYRGDRSRSQQGLGLGLSYVDAVVAAHQGRVVLTSTLHKGSCFEVHLPLNQEKSGLERLSQAATQEKSQTKGE